MTTSPRSALERLTRWRNKEEGWWYYTGSDAFNEDVLALLALLEWRPISEAPRDRSELMLGNREGVRWGGEPETWVRGCVDADGNAWDDEGYPLNATHFRMPPLPPAPKEDKP